MKTRDRILHTSLALFNEFGEPNVTTLQIADEMDISPGNLYYHFKNKTEILVELFSWFEQQMNDLLDIDDFSASVEDQWLFLHLVFENIAQYRFLYQDMVNLFGRHEKIGLRFKRILEKKRKATILICKTLEAQGVLTATDKEIFALAENIVLTATYWISYAKVMHGSQGDSELNQGVFQVMSLVAPYLRAEEREQLQVMGEAYL